MLIHKHTLRKYKTERRGFEPPDAFTSPVFKTGALNRSATFPSELRSLTCVPYAFFFVLDKKDPQM